MRAVTTTIVLVVALGLVVGSCGSGDDDTVSGTASPRVELIAPAVEAIAAERGGELELIEVSATLDDVAVIVRDESASNAVLYRYDGELTGPVEPRRDDRETFSPDAIDIQPDRLFDQLYEELDDPAVIDFAIHVDGGVVVYDATVASADGGVLFVLLSGDGQIGGLQAA